METIPDIDPIRHPNTITFILIMIGFVGLFALMCFLTSWFEDWLRTWLPKDGDSDR